MDVKRVSLLGLLLPERLLLSQAVWLVLVVVVWTFLVGLSVMPVSSLLLLIVIPFGFKWRMNMLRFGLVVTVLSVLMVLQSLHMLEHTVQLVQYFWLDWPAGRSLGLFAPANVEWVHFLWNWLVWLGVVFIVSHGVRGAFGWLLLIWASAHSLEHTYLLYRYFIVVAELNALGLEVSPVTQALPGVLGRDGWLALSNLCGRIPGLTTAPRVLIHFWWNAGEFVLLLFAAHRYLLKRSVSSEGSLFHLFVRS